MEFLLKRIPAFSRALGEWESDEDSEIEAESQEDFPCFDSSDKPVTLSHVFRQLTVGNVLIGIGPLQTAFVTCAYQLSKENMIAVVSYHVPSFGGMQKTVQNQVHIHYKPSVGEGTAFVLIPVSKQVPHINLRAVVQLIMDNILNPSGNSRRDFKATILCTQPMCQFQSRTPPDIPSFIRVLTTENLKKPKNAQWDWLEKPNIISGQAAEFLTWSKIHSISAVLCVLFYTPLDNPGYAWQSSKEMFRALCQMQILSPVLASATSNWDTLDDSALKDSCIMYVCGDKPSKMDQMYT
ncbi:hypothetical protein D915_002638 [Fasciola hepatica]|uniref:Proteasome assembly chaperone 1 n=1 Tax=Fasciola hepatica TaxID=6192 RepID=A0A4E0S1D3_FASHE|nr:hypothetical protein D915_002638 [Fasciola hepatica]